MSSFFNTPNPFGSPVGQLIDTSTDPLNPDSNVELYFEICDLINMKEENAKDALRAIRKKISIYSGKNWAVVLKLLSLLETCSNNCNKRFQVMLANKEFLQELKSMIGPKLQPPIIIQEKVLYLIQHWATIFKNDQDFKTIESFYTELRTKGIDFPVYDPESASFAENAEKPLSLKETTKDLNQMPKSGVNLNLANQATTNNNSNMSLTSPTRQSTTQPRNPNVNPQQFQRLIDPPISGTVIKLNDDQIVKLNSEIDIVESNVQVLNEILTEVNNAVANGSLNIKQINQTDKDIVLLRELFQTCKEMQKRITQLIGNISNENIINELLRVNDDLNNAFLRYERFQKNQPSQSQGETNRRISRKEDEKPLIDFDDDNQAAAARFSEKDLSSSIRRMDISSKKPPAEDIDFLSDENEIKEMESWLKTQEGLDFEKELNLNKMMPTKEKS